MADIAFAPIRRSKKTERKATGTPCGPPEASLRHFFVASARPLGAAAGAGAASRLGADDAGAAAGVTLIAGFGTPWASQKRAR